MQSTTVQGYRLSPQQRHLWIVKEGQPGSAYMAQLALLIEGELEPALLRLALTDVIGRHEILRTSFCRLPGMKTPVQVVEDEALFSWEEQDATDWEALLQQASRIEVSNGAPVQALLFALAPYEHLLVVRLPALCCDTAGVGILAEEIGDCYAARLGMGVLQDVLVQYADLAEWQNELLESDETALGRNYWTSLGLVERLLCNLPFGTPSAGKEFQPQAVSIPLEGSKLQSLAYSEGVSLRDLLLAVWQVLLWRLNGHAEVVVGVAFEGRRHEPLGRSLGLLARYLPVSCPLQKNVHLSEVMVRLRKICEEMRDWQEYFAPDVDLDAEERIALLPYKFEFDEISEPHAAGGLRWSILSRSANIDNFRARLSIILRSGHLTAELQYDPGCLQRVEAQQLASYFEAFIGSVFEEPRRPLETLSLLGPSERWRLLVELNEQPTSHPFACCAHQLIQRQAALTPDAIAVEEERGATLSFAELRTRVRRLASRLRQLGVKPEVVVGLCAERSLEMVVGVLAILEAGGAFLPLDPAYPRERLAWMLTDSPVAVLLTQEHTSAVLPAHAGHEIQLERDENLSEGNGEGANIELDHAAYVIYTSGSTGVPKGVVITHRSLVHHLLWVQSAYGLEASDHTLLKTPLSFDVAVRELLWPLMVGTRLIVASPGAHQDPAHLASLAIEHEVTVLNLVPTLLQAFVDQVSPVQCPALRLVLSGGEELPSALRDRFLSWSTAQLYNHYGPTEATITATRASCAFGEPRSQVPIGLPINGVRSLVLDLCMEPVPTGLVGELYLGGPTLSRGYLRRPELTAGRFVPDPFGALVGTPGGRLYKTGDLVRYAPDGRLEFLGRIDQQVKIYGLRIELEEIEIALAAHPDVLQAVVTAREAPFRQLVAFVAPRRWPAPSELLLASFLRERIPEFMVPTAWTILQALPLTPSGKLDRRALLESAERHVDGFVAPGTAVEEILAGIWSSLLGRHRIGVQDDFFRLGGHSLLGTQLIARIREVLRVDISLRSLFEAPTIASLANRIEAMRQQRREDQGRIMPVARDAELPLSFSQTRLWFLDRIDPSSPAYNVPAAVRLCGKLDIARLGQVVSEIVRRHESLRTVFPSCAGSPVQTVLAPRSCNPPLIDFGAIAQDLSWVEAWKWAIQEARRPFDLEKGPLLRIVLTRIAVDDHLIIMIMHHIVSDGWSRGVLVYELETLYRAFGEGIVSPLPDLPIQYADFAVWQRQRLTQETFESDLAYWRRQLAGGPALLPLPLDRPRPAVHRSRGRCQPFAIAAELSEALAELGRQRNATSFMVLLAVFQTLLLRYTGETEIRVGTPVSGRNQTQVEGLIGVFVNTLVLSADLAGNPGFNRLLLKVRDVALDAYAHQDLPFERLVEDLQPQRDLAYAPLFQVVLAFQNLPQKTVDLPGLRLEVLELDTGTAKFDLTLNLTRTPDGTLGFLEYNTDLFEGVTISRFLWHFANLLSEVSMRPETRLHDLLFLRDAERHQLVVECSQDTASEDRGETITGLFERQREDRFDMLAVTETERHLSYGELDRRANQLALRLVSLGIKPESVVGVCLDLSMELVIALLAVLKSGGAYIPLDPTYPRERLRLLVEDAGIEIILSEERLVSLLPEDGVRIIRLDTDGWWAMSSSRDRVPSGATAANLAYVIHTSGSTGRPKGALIEHRSVVHLLSATGPWFRFGPDDVWTLFHSFAFDFSVWEIWGSLLTGGRLVVVPRPVGRAPATFCRLLREQEVTVLNQTPSAFRQLVRMAEDGDLDLAGLHTLRLVIFGGEALDIQSLRPWFERHGDVSPRLVNMYGITETTVHVTYQTIHASDCEANAGRIGRPIPGLVIYVLDAYGQLVPTGIAGEIYVGGAGLARGYLGRPDLTASRFVPNPFGPAGSRLYRTGDLARRFLDGVLEYLGRTDHQVKVRGFRIELGEVEAVLAIHPAVVECVVQAWTDASGHCSLVAWVVLRDGRAARVDELRGFLLRGLPDYMIPSAFVFLEALPLTGNGKLDRRALPAPGQGRPEMEIGYVAPSNEIEEILAGVWSQVLRVAEVGVDDNFFALGGDSILSLRIQAMAQERGFYFPLQRLFQHQTIRQLAREIQTSTFPEEKRPAPFSLISELDLRRLPAGLEDAYPLTVVQSGMLYHMSYMPDAIVYHNVYSYDLRGPFCAEAFSVAATFLVARHPILRTSFDLTSYSEPLQLVHHSAALPVPVRDLRHLDPGEQDEALEKLVEEEKGRSFDVAIPPLVRLHLCRRSEDVFNLIFTEFHPIFDGWSLHSFFREIGETYLALLNDRCLTESPLRLAVRDFVGLEMAALESEECQAYWREKLRDCQVLEVPRWAPPAPLRNDGRIQVLRHQLSDDLFAGLKSFARSQALPLKSVLLAAHIKAMSIVSGQTDILTGLVSSGRPEGLDGDRILGLFFNVLPFRLVVEEGTWTGLARGVFDAERDILPYRRYPLVQMQKDRGGKALFEVLFNYIHFYMLGDLLRSGELEFINDFRRWEETNIPLSVAFEQDPLSRRLRLSFRYDGYQFGALQMEKLLQLYERILQAMASASHEKHSLPLHSEAERHQYLVEWNDTELTVHSGRPVHECFEEQVNLTPDAVAVVFENEQLTRAELDAKANRLAWHLRKAGVGIESVVGLCLERSMEMLVALLGVWKAGGAYLPLDPSHPRERLAFMLEEAKASMVITHGQSSRNLPARGGPVIDLSAEAEALAKESSEGLCVDLPAKAAAYVLFTSGSTGHPKGVVVEHCQLRNYLEGVLARLDIPAGASFAMVSTYTADLGNTVLFPSLCKGGCLHLVSELRAADAAALAKYASCHTIDVLKIVPSHLSALLTSSRPADLLPRRCLVLGGEASNWALRREIRKLAPDCSLFNHYGPTETTVGVATYRDEGGEERLDCATLPIGRPLANSQIFILDKDIHPVPIGVCGEIYIGGDGLARGYVNRPALTADRFIPDPLGLRAGARLYRTGDLARALTDGNVEFLGRADQQVKIRGFRIELREIEAVLRRHEAVREALVSVCRNETGEPRLVAYTVADPSPGLSELRSLLRRYLPEFMVPSAFVALNAIPRTTNGKVDYRSLPLPAEVSTDWQPAYLAPRSALEHTITTLWQEVLKIEKIGVNDNFFDLGGHSLFMLRIHSKIREALRADFPMVTLFEHPTIAALAEYLTGEEPIEVPEAEISGRARFRHQAVLSKRSKKRARGAEIEEFL